jgi:hypothetical protein
MSAPVTYRSGTPRDQHPAVTRWQARLRGLATAIHETSGLALESMGEAEVVLETEGLGAVAGLDGGIR